MDHLTIHEFQALLEYQHPRCVSVYLPTPEVGAEGYKREVEFRNLTNDALSQLSQVSLSDLELKHIVKSMHSCMEDEAFWKQGNQGFAVLVSPEVCHCYRLPIPVSKLAIVSFRFHLKPLLPLVTQPCEFYLLSLSQRGVELLRGDRYQLTVQNVPDLPQQVEEVVGTETGERHLQFHTKTTAPNGSTRPGMYHGSSSWKDDKQRLLERFLQQVATAVEKYLRNSEAPLILSGVERMITIYSDVNKYGHFLSYPVIKGNTEHESLAELHNQAMTLLQPYFNQQEREVVEKYFSRGEAGKISNDISEILRQARMGRVDTLLVAKGIRRWGQFDPNTLQVTFQDEQQPMNHDLLDLACAQTLLTGGKAYVLPPEELPTQSPAAAVFRY